MAADRAGIVIGVAALTAASLGYRGTAGMGRKADCPLWIADGGKRTSNVACKPREEHIAAKEDDQDYSCDYRTDESPVAVDGRCHA